MKKYFKRSGYTALLASMIVLPFLGVGSAGAAVSAHTMAEFTSYPLASSGQESVVPMVMIATSNDHQLFFKAYDDYSDLDGNGVIDTNETTYNHNYDYYGYFDSYKCYNYSTTNNRFEPASITNDKYCSGNWSGNFLNWATMTRIDTIRKILFGGHRRVDTSSETVLERSYLPHDAHSFAKHYAGTDISQLTPFSPPTQPPTGTSSTGTNVASSGTKTLRVSGGQWRSGDYVRAVPTSAREKYMEGYIEVSGNNIKITVSASSGAGSTSYSSWELTNYTRVGVTFCNTTDVPSTSVKSQDVTAPPLLKAVEGNYSLWTSNERWQCTWASGAPSDNHAANNGNNPTASGIYAQQNSPSYNDRLGQYVVRVQACVSNLIGQEKCKRYPRGNYKPIGLLQTYGDDDRLLFGMLAGSYSKNKSGGDLIYDIGSMRREIDVDNYGTFTNVAQAAGGPKANNKAEGMINAWSLYRIYGYDHSDGTYNNSGSGDNCSWGQASFNEGKCTNWGNPFAEIFLNTLRYLAGQSPSGTFRANDSNMIRGLNQPQVWNCPLDSTNRCANLSVVNFNSSGISYDGDALDGQSDGVGSIGSTQTSAQLTDIVGEGEGIHGNIYFVGENGSDNNQLCTPKTVTSLGRVEGICPEVPRLDGTYRLAGIAHYAHTNDIRPPSAGPRALDGVQKVDTYSVALATSVPKIVIPVPGATNQSVTILPACRNKTVGGNCAIVAFKVVKPHTVNGNVAEGSFYVNWEDSEQGGDYDQDMWGTISYVIDGSARTIDITTEVHAQSTGDQMGFGYVISGTTNDGFHVHSGINRFKYTDSATIVGGSDCSGTNGCRCTSTDGAHAACNIDNRASTARYTLGTSTAQLLQDPLYYAAKWGGFRDENGNNIPDLQSEYDRYDNITGIATPDGIPDNYFYSTNPKQLEEALTRVFNEILTKTASGTAAAVVASSREGTGAVYQAMFETQRMDARGRKARWIGNVQALWIDDLGWMREDNGNGVLDDYHTDPVVTTFYDPVERKTMLRRYTSESAYTFDPATATYNDRPLEDINPLWAARPILASMSNESVKTQRNYGSSAVNGRHIITWIDEDRDGVIDDGEVVAFDENSINSSNYGFLDVDSEAEADKIVNFVRGVEIEGYRSRTLDYDNDGTPEVMRLGDIVNSTPTVVGAPAEEFDLLYRDRSYGEFRAKYKNRRKVIYVGANDGMLHAFNGGFFTIDASGQKKFVTSMDSKTAHPLGAELWAYVPFNLLPHLKWLKDPDYTHVYYVDGKPRVFDAKIFSDDTDHPGGWGTVLVVGMNLGGGAMTVDTGADGFGGQGAANDMTFRSAYVLLDVTNPEVPPKVLAEITHPNLGFTTSYPTAMAVREANDGEGTVNKWYLIFGTGPTSLSSGSSTQVGRILVYDLNNMEFVSGFGPTDSRNKLKTANGSDFANSFVGAPVSVDWNLSYIADAVYFGAIGGTPASPTGRLYKIQIRNPGTADNHDAAVAAVNPTNWVGPKVLLDTNQPINVTPSVSVDNQGNHWVFTGTGRFFVTDDKSSTAQQTLYGIKDPWDRNNDGQPDSIENATEPLVNINELLDVTNAVVYTDHTVTGVSDASTFNDLITMIDGNPFASPPAAPKPGWKLNLPAPGTSASTRVVAMARLYGEMLLPPVYTPSSDLCTGEGKSDLYALYYKTGTAYPGAPIGTTTVDGKLVAVREVDLGAGLAATPGIHVDKDTGKISLRTQTSTGSFGGSGPKGVEVKTPVQPTSGETSWRLLPR